MVRFAEVFPDLRIVQPLAAQLSWTHFSLIIYLDGPLQRDFYTEIETPADLLPHVRHYADRKQEHFLCATINGANEILNIRVVSIGLIDRSPVHPREVFADALADRASAVIVAHNHPSGQLEPSPGDVNITAQLKAAGAIVGVELLDRIIFNRTGYFSFLKDGRL